MSAFIGSSDEFPLSFYMKRVKGRSLDIVTEDDNLTEAAAQKLINSEYTKMNVMFKLLTWGENNRIERECVTIDPETNMRYMDGYAYDAKLLSSVIKSWDFKIKNNQGDIVPVDPEVSVVKKMHPKLAEYLLSKYREEGEVGDSDEKK